MAFTSGTATNYLDMLDKLRVWLTGTVGWTQLYFSTAGGKGQTSPYMVQFSAPGSGSGRNVFVNIKASTTPATNIYSLELSAAVGFDNTVAWGVNPGESTPVFMNTWNQAIGYWFYANDRRVIIIAKCSTTYISAYAGFFLPWAQPSQYPFPLYVGADYHTGATYNFTNSGRRMFCDPGGLNTARAAYARSPDGLWNALYNHVNGTGNDSAYSGANRGDNYFVWPYVSAGDYSSAAWADTNGVSGAGIFDQIDATAQGDRLILPIHINSTRRPALGALDGVYCPLGAGLSAEQIVSAGGKSLRAFQNISRNSENDFFLIDEV